MDRADTGAPSADDGRNVVKQMNVRNGTAEHNHNNQYKNMGAHSRIEDNIAFNRIAPASSFKVNELYIKYGAGVTPVRDVLIKLTHEYLIENFTQRGYSAKLTAKVASRDLRPIRSRNTSATFRYSGPK
ncbi:GntR family transcriptional regulator [Methylobacterium nodulans]|uniref:GntR family transcriptional regulator n=1 Tax=Methylobacterium nodulans TaxID=114616 RepID=UPI0009FECDB5|nr:GntR family transcriptional regulator [Methylobacterium nodulans]